MRVYKVSVLFFLQREVSGVDMKKERRRLYNAEDGKKRCAVHQTNMYCMYREV
jgi:hypothetical protein